MLPTTNPMSYGIIGIWGKYDIMAEIQGCVLPIHKNYYQKAAIRVCKGENSIGGWDLLHWYG